MKKNYKILKIIFGLLSVIFIIYLWTKKDVGLIYDTMPKEEKFTLIFTTFIVTLSKVILLSAGVLVLLFLIQIVKRKK